LLKSVQNTILSAPTPGEVDSKVGLSDYLKHFRNTKNVQLQNTNPSEQPHREPGAVLPVQDTFLSPATQGGYDSHDALSDYLKHFRFRNTEDVQTLLTDKRGVRIPRDILEVIVKCMLRDVEGCYYRRDPNLAFLWKGSYDAATLIRDRIKELLALQEYQ